MSRRFFKNSQLMLAALLLMGAAREPLSLEKGSREPMVVTSDRMEADQLGSTVTFISDVTLKKETMTLTSDQLVVYYDPPSKSVREIEAVSNVVVRKVRTGQFVRDWHEALAVQGGFLEVRNLPAGDYSLYLKPEAREIAVAVTQGQDQHGFIYSPRRALERPRLAPVQVAAVEPGAETVEIRLANATTFTRVHVFAIRYLPAYDVFAKLGFARAAGLQQQRWQPSRTFYETGRDIGDEYRYVLDRQTARKFPGNMLERPGLLHNPWALRDTEAQLGGTEVSGAHLSSWCQPHSAGTSRRSASCRTWGLRAVATGA